MIPLLVAQRLKHLPLMQETQVRSLGQEDPLEKEMATHSSILAGKSRDYLTPLNCYLLLDEKLPFFVVESLNNILINNLFN